MSGKNLLFFVAFTLFLGSCISINISDPMGKQYNEVILQGTENDKIALLSINGVINDKSEKGFLNSSPGLLQDFLTQLNLAEQDPEVKGVLIKINSPGGSVTTSDIVYNEIKRFKKRSNKKVIVCMMDMATSGGYYISLAADYIIANPTTITGSVGVIFMHPEISTLTDKIGINMKINKSGKNKDMGSTFRLPTKEEEELFNKLISDLADRFYLLLKSNRTISKESFDEIKTARIFLAKDAKRLGLIDEIAYLNDAIYKTMELSEISRNSKLIAYRPSKLYYDNVYNNLNTISKKPFQAHLEDLFELRTGFYYLWEPGLN